MFPYPSVVLLGTLPIYILMSREACGYPPPPVRKVDAPSVTPYYCDGYLIFTSQVCNQFSRVLFQYLFFTCFRIFNLSSTRRIGFFSILRIMISMLHYNQPNIHIYKYICCFYYIIMCYWLFVENWFGSLDGVSHRGQWVLT